MYHRFDRKYSIEPTRSVWLLHADRGLLNLEITDNTIPWSVPAIQILSGIAIPFIAAAFPLLRGSRISVRAALDNYGVSAKSNPVSFLSRLPFVNALQRHISDLHYEMHFVSAPALRLHLDSCCWWRNVHDGLNVSEAWDKNLKRIYVQRLYDQEIKLNDRINPDSVIERIKSLNGVTTVEGWDYSSSSIVKAR